MTAMGNLPEVVSREEWLAARRELLVKEKELTRARDRLNADRRRLPMVRVDKQYTFEGPDGTVGLLDLFGGRPQLVMHHFMFGPDWDQGCPSCSSAADGIGRLRQLYVRNTTLVAVSRAPGISAFLRVGEEVFHTYSTFGRGIEEFHNGYQYLDLTALGRQEEWEEPTGRAVPLGLQVGGPAMRLPDEYDTP